jgi:homoserine kinase
MNEIKIFCPATIANLSCGFDVLGLCLDNGDEMIIRKSNQKGFALKLWVLIYHWKQKETLRVLPVWLLDAVETDFGFDIEIYKTKAGSGIGSSAASAAGAVYGINALLGTPFETKDLVQFAMQGENGLWQRPC